jgi:hypothetical protein
MLGGVERTRLHIESFAWNVPTVRVRVMDGSVQLRVCREGGTRLFSAERVFMLRQNHPNPFNATTVMEYELIEEGYTELAVLDLLGRTAAELDRGIRRPGRYTATFDASRFPSGLYAAVLRTPTQMSMRIMRLLK